MDPKKAFLSGGLTASTTVTPEKNKFIQNQVYGNNSATSPKPPVQSSTVTPPPVAQPTDSGLSKEGALANLQKGGFIAPGGTTLKETTTPSDPKTDYLAALAKLSTPSEEEKNLTKNLSDINSTIFGKKYDAMEEGQTILDTPGGLKSGAQQSAEVAGRRSNAELARLGVQQNSAANALDAVSSARKSQLEGSKPVILGSDAYDPITGKKLYSDPKANEPFSLSEGQQRYEYNEKTGKYELAASAPKTATGSALTETQLMSFAQNPSSLNSLSPAKKSEVILAMAKAGIKVPNANSDALQAYSLANELSSMNTDAITGAGQFLPSITNAATLNKYDQLKAVLSLENRAKLKGSGAISDFEARTLESAASSLGRNLSNSEFKKELNKVKGVLGSAAGLAVPVTITDSKTKQTKQGVLDREGINSAMEQGYSVEYN